MAHHPNISNLLTSSPELNIMNAQWRLEEIQSPVAGRKSSPNERPRAIDPPPVVRLFCSVDPHILLNFNRNDLVCSVDLFRLPEQPNMRYKWSYYRQNGTFDHGQPIYELSVTDYPPREIEARVGNHLLLDESKETHLLHRQTVAQAVEIPNSHAIVFAFPNLGVLQTGQYLLRYTLYNRSMNGPPLAKCFGQPFTILTVNNFGGIQPPTVLSQQLAQLRVPGFR